jgi:hypothetical protein
LITFSFNHNFHFGVSLSVTILTLLLKFSFNYKFHCGADSLFFFVNLTFLLTFSFYCKIHFPAPRHTDSHFTRRVLQLWYHAETKRKVVVTSETVIVLKSDGSGVQEYPLWCSRVTVMVFKSDGYGV